MSLPVCLIGVALALLLGGLTLNMFSLMAMVILVGMVVNNAIIVVDYAARERHEGVPARVAIRDACELRFRMIVMANLTTVVALIPLSLGLGFAGEIFRPLAVVQMGGILAAAVLSLLVIPVIYSIARGRRNAAGTDG
jgi:HAE1 family hydrophobic/amphiphilic exporter-1